MTPDINIKAISSSQRSSPLPNFMKTKINYDSFTMTSSFMSHINSNLSKFDEEALPNKTNKNAQNLIKLSTRP
jgi:hypothetical protein